jgi:hypothetical protein
MVRLSDLEPLLSERMNRTLTVAQAALPESQFRAFRKLFLDEFGKNGLLTDLDRLFADSSHSPERHGSGRNTLRKRGGVP